jgi:hypothetical protein
MADPDAAVGALEDDDRAEARVATQIEHAPVACTTSDRDQRQRREALLVARRPTTSSCALTPFMRS